MSKTSYRERSATIAKERRLRPIIQRVIKAVKVFSITLFIGSIVWFLNSQWLVLLKDESYRLINNFYDNTGLKLENIYLDGLVFLDTDTVLAELPIWRDGIVKEVPILEIALPDLKERLESMGWVREANIERQLPNTLHIGIVEQKPVAIWQYNGDLALIDIDGIVISRQDVPEFADLPIIVGEDANLHTKAFFSFITLEEVLSDKVVSAIRIGGRRWNIRLDNGIEVKLPEENPEKAWHHLAELHKEKLLLSRNIEMIDMRVHGRVFMKEIDGGN